MEPVAPGTEDDVQLPYSGPSKKDLEYERLLSIKAILQNGQYGNVFELSYNNGVEQWYCNLCQCPIMGRVYPHEIGKRHTYNISLYNSSKNSKDPENVQNNSTSEGDSEQVIQVAPGEPVPPGFEGEVQKVAQLQEHLDSFKFGPLLGLEYLVEMIEDDRDKEPSYQCMLCDKRGDPRTVIAHLASYKHMQQYLQRHFPTCYRLMAPYLTNQYKRKNLQNVVNNVAEAIEAKYGRLKPLVVDKELFEQKRAHYWNLIQAGKHFSEKMGQTFENLVSVDEITKSNAEDKSAINKPSGMEDFNKRNYRKTGTIPGSEFSTQLSKKETSPSAVNRQQKPKPASVANREIRRSLSSVSTISSNDLSDAEDFSDGKSQFGNGGRRGGPPLRRSPNSRWGSSTRKIEPRRGRSPYNRRYDRDRERSPRSPRTRRTEDLMPWQRSDYKKSKAALSKDTEKPKPKNDKYEEFRKLASAIEKDMEKQLKQHESNPEKHPQYNEEWKIFWNKRYKELQADGKDTTNHDFKPEWIEFWNKRMIELHNAEVKAKKDALRKRLSLPEEPAPICFRITGRKRPTSSERSPRNNKPLPVAAQPDQDHEVIVIEDGDDDTKSSKRSHSPWETESLPRSGSRISREKSRDRDRRDRSSRDRSYDRGDYYGRNRERIRDRSPRKRSYSREKSWDKDISHYRSTYRKEKEPIPSAYRPPTVMRDVTSQPVYSPPPIRDISSQPGYPLTIMRDVTRHPVFPPAEEPPETDNDEVNIVSVLRLLTALEEKLGSLGPKINDLLANALAMENAEPNSSETLLDNEVNCVLFETVKEKLKGQLMAGLVDISQERAFKNATKNIAKIIHEANERKKERERNKPKLDPIKVPGIGTVDKTAIAKQIAAALVMQGKTDVTQAELEQLINAVVGMAEASRNSNKPVTTASFLQSLGQTKQESQSTPFKMLQNSSTKDDISHMDGLSDSDLQTLLQNFKDLSTDEQHSLISYLKKLEAREPERVERLRKFVNLGNSAPMQTTSKVEEKSNDSSRASPFTTRLDDLNPEEEEKVDDQPAHRVVEPKEKYEKSTHPINIDSDEEEYSMEDVFRAAKKNVIEKEDKEKEEKSKKEVDLTDAKAIIANLMGNISKKNQSTSGLINATNTNPNSPLVQSQSGISFDNLQNLPVNMNNLADIVSNVKHLGQSNASRDENTDSMEAYSNSGSYSDNHNLDNTRTTGSNFDDRPSLGESFRGGPINNRMGHGPVNMGHSSSNMGGRNLPVNNMPPRQGLVSNSLLGPGPTSLSAGPNKMGAGPNNMGLGLNSMGVGLNSMGPGANSMGSNSGNIGPMGPGGSMTSGPNNMGPISPYGMGRNNPNSMGPRLGYGMSQNSQYSNPPFGYQNNMGYQFMNRPNKPGTYYDEPNNRYNAPYAPTRGGWYR